MRVAKLVLAAVCVAALLTAANAWAAVVYNPIGVVASSEFGGGERPAIHTIDESGLSGSVPADSSGIWPTAGTTQPGNTMWMEADPWVSGATHGTPWIYFDLGSQQEVGGIAVWNYNETYYAGPPSVDLTGQGFKDVDVLVSNDATNWTYVESVVFAQAPGNMDTPVELISLQSAATARYIKLDATSNWQGDAQWAGLQEVRFLDGSAAVPEPGTIVLLGIGLLGLLCYAWRKRK